MGFREVRGAALPVERVFIPVEAGSGCWVRKENAHSWGHPEMQGAGRKVCSGL